MWCHEMILIFTWLTRIFLKRCGVTWWSVVWFDPMVCDFMLWLSVYETGWIKNLEIVGVVVFLIHFFLFEANDYVFVSKPCLYMVFLKVSLNCDLGLWAGLFHMVSFPYRNCFRVQWSGILETWLAHLTWFLSR